MPPESNPKAVFDRLFAGGSKKEIDENKQRRERYRKSILDFALEDAKRLEKKLGYTDKRKLDEYLDSVRELEKRIEAMAKSNVSLPEGFNVPAGKPRDFGTHVRLMSDMMALAFQTDSTRISSYLLAHDGDNRSYPHLGVRQGHHSISHHRNAKDKLADLTKINRYHCTLFAHFLDRLKGIKEGGTVGPDLTESFKKWKNISFGDGCLSKDPKDLVRGYEAEVDKWHETLEPKKKYTTM